MTYFLMLLCVFVTLYVGADTFLPWQRYYLIYRPGWWCYVRKRPFAFLWALLGTFLFYNIW